MSRCRSSRPLVPIIASVLMHCVACQAPPSAAPAATALATGPWEVVRRPPPEVQEVILARWAAHRHERANRTTIVYLNFDGQTLQSGADSNAKLNLSFLVPEGTSVDYPAFDATPYGASREEVIAAIVAKLEELFAGFDVQFTTTRPAAGNYMMTMIGGRMDVIQQPDGVLGVSPLDCTVAGTEQTLDPNALDINFIFSESCAESGLNLTDLVFVIAHENAHTYGLGHIERPADIMYWATSGGEQLSWGAGAVRAGEESCSLDGSQDDIDYLSRSIGGHPRQESDPPAVAITSPQQGATMTDGWQAEVSASDPSGILRVEMYSNGDFWMSAAEAPYTFYFRSMQPGVYALRARAVDWYANATVSEIVTVIVPRDPPPTCTADADCGHGALCQKGVCVDPTPPPTAGDLGAACASDLDCGAGPCLAASSSYCSAGCREDAGIYCPYGFGCGEDFFCHSLSSTPPGGAGAPCSGDEQCQHGVCADLASGQGYCTQTCTADGPACPGGAGCRTLADQTQVCGRPSRGGCAAAPAGAGGGGAGAALLVALALGLGRRRARRP